MIITTITAKLDEVINSKFIESSCFMGRYTVYGSGADCKSAVNDSGGSIPPRPTTRSVPSTYNVTLAQFEDTAKGKSSGAHSDADLNARVGEIAPLADRYRLLLQGRSSMAEHRSLKPLYPSEGGSERSSRSALTKYRPFQQSING